MRAGIGTGGMNPNVIQVNEMPVGQLQPTAPMQTPAQAAPQRQGLLGGFFGPQGRDARSRLAIALEGMTLNPNQALIGQLQQGIEDRKAEGERNRTLEWLSTLNTPEAQRALQYAQATGDIVGAAKMALTPTDPMAALEQEKLSLEVDKLRNPQPEFRRATPEEAAAYGAQSGQFGPDGRFYAVDVPQGMTIESDGAGGFRLIQGPGAATSVKPPTEGQLAGAGYLQRMTSAENILRDVERRAGVVSIPLEKTILMETGAEGFVLNPTEQSIAQAQRDWVRAKLRKESGAVIGAEEMAAEIRTYFPQPGEGPETVAQKAESRRRAERQMQIGSGSAAEQAGEISPEYAAPIRADELSRAGIGGGPASQPVVINGVTIRKVN